MQTGPKMTSSAGIDLPYQDELINHPFGKELINWIERKGYDEQARRVTTNPNFLGWTLYNQTSRLIYYFSLTRNSQGTVRINLTIVFGMIPVDHDYREQALASLLEGNVSLLTLARYSLNNTRASLQFQSYTKHLEPGCLDHLIDELIRVAIRSKNDFVQNSPLILEIPHSWLTEPVY